MVGFALASRYEASIEFFRPRAHFLDWIQAQYGRRCFVELGAGLATLTRALLDRGMEGIATDLSPSSEAVCEVIPIDACRFKYAPALLPILARPSRGAWIRETIRRAVEGSGLILYIGLEKHYEADLAELPFHVERVLEDAGEGGEIVWRISCEKEKVEMAKRTFERVVQIKIDDKGPYLVGLKADGMKYWDCGASYAPFEPDRDIIVREFEYNNDDDLDAIDLIVAQEQAPTPQEVCARLAWISPEGHFFPCAYTTHKDLATKLCARYLGKWGRSEDLLKVGWAQVIGGGVVVRDVEGAWPQAMLDTLGKMVLAFTEAQAQGVNFNLALRNNPECYDTLSMVFSQADENGDLVEYLKGRYEWHLQESECAKVPAGVEDIITKRRDAHPGD